MEDPAYTNGVRSESIVEMFQSVTDVFKGKSSYILLPVPMDKIAPATHISFHSRKAQHPKPLSFSSKAPQSRRSYGYSLSSGSSIAPSIAESQGHLPLRRSDTDSTHDEIMSTIENFATMSIAECDDDDVVIDDTIPETVPEPPATVRDNTAEIPQENPANDNTIDVEPPAPVVRRRGRRVGV